MGPPHWHGFAPPLEDVTGRDSETAARLIALRMRLIAHDLRGAGIDGNCAPLADIAFPETHPILRNRCYGESVQSVICAARACADALLAGGVLPVLKHIPGHGRAVVDSHLETPTLRGPLADLRAVDFAPFRALADLPLGMTGHLVIPQIDPDLPVTVSPAGIALIRKEIGFSGLLMTDDLSMEALGGTQADRALRARAAGCDVILHCNGNLAEMDAVVAAAGRLEGISVTRAQAALAARQAPDTVDIAALEAELVALRSGGADGR
jgi:beta-N-acetylhexosaminidase